MANAPYDLAKYLSRASSLLKRPGDLLGLSERIADNLASGKYGEQFNQVLDDLKLMLALIPAWARGDYKAVESSSILGMAAALLYLFAPVDAIPDFILGLGLVDDVAVLTFMAAKLRHELDAFKAWRGEKQ